MTHANPPIILLHGLARSPRAMVKLQRAVLDGGTHNVANIGYPSTKHSIEQLATDHVLPSIEQFLQKHGYLAHTPLDFITHSMGGIILRVLAKTSKLRIHRAVMLAPPNGGSEVVDKIGYLAPFYWINGPAGRQLATIASASKGLTSLPRQLGSVDFTCGIIAGDNSTHHLKDPTTPLLPKPNDGKVSVASTKVAGMSDHIVLPYSHTFIMNKNDTVRQVRQFLKTGSFFN